MNSSLLALLAYFLPVKVFGALFNNKFLTAEAPIDVEKAGDHVHGMLDAVIKFFEGQKGNKEGMLGLLIIAAAAVFAKLKNIMIGLAAGVVGFIMLVLSMGENGNLSDIINNLLEQFSSNKKS
jgi:hypothetical protein